MNLDRFKGKEIEVKSTGQRAIVDRVKIRRGAGGLQSARIVILIENEEHELMPHEVIFDPK